VTGVSVCAYGLPRASAGRGRTVCAVRVWIDQDLCTGDGLCVDYAPDVFVLLEDGIAYVVDAGKVCNDPGGAGGVAAVPESLERMVVDAASVCPGECIMVES
jgi:ferredoxin